jgi:ribosomal protein L22
MDRMKHAAAAPNVRISRHAHDVLRRIAEEEHSSMQSVLDRVIEIYRRDRFLRAANADFAALKSDPKAWKKELQERELWDRALPDGLDQP